MENIEYLDEFQIKSIRVLFHPTEMTPDDKLLWTKYLEIEGEQTLEYYLDDWIEEMLIVEFYWHHDNTIDIVTSINSWPGDNPAGMIVLGNDIVFINADSDLLPNENLIAGSKAEKLSNRWVALDHILKHSDDCEHEICKQFNGQLKSFYIDNTCIKYQTLYVIGPMYKHPFIPNCFSRHPCKGQSKSKYRISELIDDFPYVEILEINESSPVQATIKVPKEKVEYVKTEMEKEHYSVLIANLQNDYSQKT